jgi:glycosyltransferase involved in cell wall biosynthesis
VGETERGMTTRDIVLLSTADWDNPFWTNKQHVAVELARRGFRVLYIDSLGLRRPSASAQDAGRVWRRLRKAAAGPQRVRESLWVWSPVVLPLQASAAVRRFNRAWLTGGLRRQLTRLGMKPDLLWTYNPLTTQLLALDDFKTVVYHCVDEIKAQPGMPAAALDAAERELAGRADIVFTTTPKLTETRRAWNANTHYFPNVADFDHFAKAREPATQVPGDLAGIAAPRIGFVGAISGYKVDFRLLRHIAESRPDWSVVLIGKVGEGDPWSDPATLRGLPNLHLLGPRPYAELPGYLKGFDVALLPNTLNEYTEAMFPLKFFEYLAAGKPVVSVDLPALRPYADTIRIAGTPEDFVKGIAEALEGNAAPLEHRLALARQHTYTSRMDRMLALLDAAL